MAGRARRPSAVARFAPFRLCQLQPPRAAARPRPLRTLELCLLGHRRLAPATPSPPPVLPCHSPAPAFARRAVAARAALPAAPHVTLSALAPHVALHQRRCTHQPGACPPTACTPAREPLCRPWACPCARRCPLPPTGLPPAVAHLALSPSPVAPADIPLGPIASAVVTMHRRDAAAEAAHSEQRPRQSRRALGVCAGLVPALCCAWCAGHAAWKVAHTYAVQAAWIGKGWVRDGCASPLHPRSPGGK